MPGTAGHAGPWGIARLRPERPDNHEDFFLGRPSLRSDRSAEDQTFFFLFLKMSELSFLSLGRGLLFRLSSTQPVSLSHTSIIYVETVRKLITS